ncbi:MAG: type II toxin-antitoxin system RelE/ParE family toxin [Chitinophagales bacterium]
MHPKFEIELLEEAFEFLSKIDLKARKKVFKNLNRAKYQTDPKFFKKLEGEIWEFRTLYAGVQYRLLAFWDKSDNKNTWVLATHGFIKKTSKVDKKEINRAESIRQLFFKNK